MSQTSLRINYTTYLPGSRHDISPDEACSLNAAAQQMHLSALGFMLANFQPDANATINDDLVCSLRSYGSLISAIANSALGETDELSTMLASALTLTAAPEVVK